MPTRSQSRRGSLLIGTPSIKKTDEPLKKQFKVILLGDGTVGKTSVCNRFAKGDFAASYKQTIGLDFFVRKVVLPDGTEVVLQIWDIGGQSIASKMVKSYVSGAHAVLLCYDVTNYESFKNLEDWFAIVDAVFEKEKPYVGLVGNKCDLSHIRAVRGVCHAKFADDNSLDNKFLMSAMSGDQVHACFLQVAAALAKVDISRNDIDSRVQNVVAAHINVEHLQHDPNIFNGTCPPLHLNPNSNTTCIIS